MTDSNVNGKEKNFISAVVYLHNDKSTAVEFFDALYRELDAHFEKFELIAINNCCTDNTVELVKEWAADISHPLTFVNMSILQGKEVCMNAGLDAAIGDYVYEFDFAKMPYSADKIYEAYEKAEEGNDIVSVCPNSMKIGSKIFYKIFNASSHSAYKLQSSAFRLVTRRAINRVHAASEYLPYRKAAYAASGLRLANIEFDGKVGRQDERVSLAADSLLLYTDAGVKISLGISLFMLVLAILELIYVVVIFCTGHPIEGWTTTMFVITLGFSGLFCLVTVMIKYLSLLLDMVFKKQKYFVESIEKIQK